MTIIEFLQARITEDEQEAKAGLAQYQRGEDTSKRRWTRMLTESKAKRTILEAHPITTNVLEVSTRAKWGFACATCFSFGDVVEDLGYCDTIRALAAVYDGHPEYESEWKI